MGKEEKRREEEKQRKEEEKEGGKEEVHSKVRVDILLVKNVNIVKKRNFPLFIKNTTILFLLKKKQNTYHVGCTAFLEVTHGGNKCQKPKGSNF